MKSEAYRTVKRILDGDTNFDSQYTTKSKDGSLHGLMTVDDESIFKDLTLEERLELANVSGPFPILNIWTHTWIYVLQEWVLIHKCNTWKESWSYNPDFVYLKDDYLLDTQNFYLYKRVSQEEPKEEPRVPLPMHT